MHMTVSNNSSILCVIINKKALNQEKSTA